MTRIPVSPQTVDALVQDGIRFYEAGDNYSALQCWKEALDHDPHHETALAWLEYLEQQVSATPPAAPAGPGARSGLTRTLMFGMDALPLLDQLPELEPLPSFEGLGDLPDLASFTATETAPDSPPWPAEGAGARTARPSASSGAPGGSASVPVSPSPGPATSLAPHEDEDGYFDLGPLEFPDEPELRGQRPSVPPRSSWSGAHGSQEQEALLIELAENAEQFSDLTESSVVKPEPVPASPLAAAASRPGGAPPAAAQPPSEVRPGLRPRSRFPEPAPVAAFPAAAIEPPARQELRSGPATDAEFDFEYHAPQLQTVATSEEDEEEELEVLEVDPEEITAVGVKQVQDDGWAEEPEELETQKEEVQPQPIGPQVEQLSPGNSAASRGDETPPGTQPYFPVVTDPRRSPQPSVGEADRMVRPEIPIERPFGGTGRTPTVPPSSARTSPGDRSRGERIPTPTGDDPMVLARAALLRDDLDAAMRWVKAALQQDPDDKLAQALHNELRDQLVLRYLKTMGGRNSVLRQKVSQNNLLRMHLDHKAGFILSYIDGQTAVDDILDLSGMDLVETLRILAQLVEQGVIEGR